MQMTTEARTWLDSTVRRILARHPLGDAERAGITYELMSHLHAAGEARATAAGRSEVAREDLEAALLEAGGGNGLAAAFVGPLAKPVGPGLFRRRLGADGGPITFRESILRNLVKLSPPLLFLDVVIMLLAFAKDKQRVSDRVAGTIVVKA